MQPFVFKNYRRTMHGKRFRGHSWAKPPSENMWKVQWKILLEF